MSKKITKASKRSKKQGEVTRLLDLEVDEVSLVDKPAIGEEIYVSKSVTKEGGTSMAKKKKVKKGEEEKPKAGAQAEGEEVEETEESEGAEGEAEGDESEADDSSDAEGSEEGEESEEGDEAASAEEVKALKSEVADVKKSLDEVTQMLAQSMDFHDQAAQALNQVIALTMGALDMLVNMSEESVAEDQAEGEAEATEASAESEGVAEAAKAVKLQIQKFHKDVEKAGAKISSSRLSILQEIATKLTALIESVVANNKDAKKGGKKAAAKKSLEHESLKSEVSELKKSLQAATDANTELKKTVDGMATKLNEIESHAGGSAGIEDDDDESDSSETEPKNKSVFAGLVPVDQIKADIRKREALAKRR